MSKADIRYAPLSDKELKRLRKLEKKFGAMLLAVEPATQLANLSDDQIMRLQALEQELGVVLLAYNGEGDEG